MNLPEDLKVIVVIFAICFLVGTGAAVDGYFDKQQEIEMAKVRCAK